MEKQISRYAGFVMGFWISIVSYDGYFNGEFNAKGDNVVVIRI